MTQQNCKTCREYTRLPLTEYGCQNCTKPTQNNVKVGDWWENELEEFALINEMYIKGFPIGKLKALIKKFEVDFNRLARQTALSEAVEVVKKLAYAENDNRFENEEMDVRQLYGGIYNQAIDDAEKDLQALKGKGN